MKKKHSIHATSSQKLKAPTKVTVGKVPPKHLSGTEPFLGQGGNAFQATLPKLCF
jgi:hypothetical protein